MASTAQDCFPWQELPVELQDWILDYCVGDEFSYFSPDYEAFLKVKNHPLWGLLAANREMKAQYEKRITERTTLVFCDHENFNFSLLPLPDKVANVKHIEVRMFVVCEKICPRQVAECQAANDLAQTVSLINKILAQLPDLDSLEISLGLWWNATEKFQWPETPHDSRLSDDILKLVQIPKLQHLAVYQVDERCLDSSQIVNQSKRLVSWTKASDAWETPNAAGSNETLNSVEEAKAVDRGTEVVESTVELDGNS